MKKKSCRSRISLILVLCLLVGVHSPATQRSVSADTAGKHPEISGLYEMKAQDSRIVRLQIYFKGGMLHTLEEGDGEVTQWEALSIHNLQFKTDSQRNGTFILSFKKDEEGGYTRFHIVNEKLGLDIYGNKTGDFNDAAADPTSKSDRLGFFERHYNKDEYLIPMRDGVRLLTHVYSPLDKSEPHPILLYREPYGIEPYGETYRYSILPSLYFAKENYILVYQDIRGRAMSEGQFNFVAPYIENKMSPADVDESSDAYDTIEWVLKNIPNHNGKVGVWGSSYPGFTAAMAAIDAHPAVAAVSPQAPMADLFLGDDGHHCGAFYLSHYVTYAYAVWENRNNPAPFHGKFFPFGTPDGYDFFLKQGTLKNITQTIFKDKNDMWDQAMAHETYDEYWKSRSIYKHLVNIKPAVMTVGGWYDGEDLLGTLRSYKAIEGQNPGLQNTLVMGPWTHSGWNMTYARPQDMGVFSFGDTAAYFQEKIELPFFNHYLMDKGTPDLPEALVFDTGSNRWESYDSWPPSKARMKKLFFGSGGRLLDKNEDPTSPTDFDRYISDPAKPVPYTLQPNTQYNREYFIEDQRFASSRPDVVTYTSDPLSEDTRVAGPLTAELYVSTTGTDADWVVKVIDVYPGDAPDPENNPLNILMGGYQRLVRGDIIRGKFRNGFEKPEPFVPGRVTKVSFELPDILHTFLKGHRIMVQVQSSWFPLFDRNPQKFCNIREADEEDFQEATHHIYRSRQHPSGILLWIVIEE